MNKTFKILGIILFILMIGIILFIPIADTTTKIYELKKENKIKFDSLNNRIDSLEKVVNSKVLKDTINIKIIE